jgi:hypothetical protein
MKRASKSKKDREIVIPAAKPKRFYGHGIPGVDLEKLTGTLFAVEGADGSGRSTARSRRPRHRSGRT